jgi:fatty aldehyde-generating acyl-ACP reductase
VEKFAFIIHPISASKDVARHQKYRYAKYLPEFLVEEIIRRKDPLVASHITGIKSTTGVEAEGWFIICPLTPRQLLTLPIDFIYKRLIQCGRLAEDLGAKILGLGAFTSVVGDGGVTVAKNLDIAVTTGNSYTVATAIEATIDGARRMEINMPLARVAIVGATGSIGRTCARILAPTAGSLSLVARDLDRLEAVKDELGPELNAKTTCYDSVSAGLDGADVIVTVTSALDVVIHPKDLKPGSVVCDVARPRDVSVRVAKERDDVLVIEGGVVAVPGDVNFNFNFGFPEKMAYACMSETMMLALEGQYESFTLGKTVSAEQVNHTTYLAQKHGFHLAGYRSFEKEVTDQKIEETLANARRRRQSTRQNSPNIGHSVSLP